MNTPQPISAAEWEEIVRVPAVRDAWGLDEDETGELFASRVYGVKFDFVSGGPGYVGDLYILQGDNLSEVPPVALIRRNGTIVPAYEPDATL